MFGLREFFVVPDAGMPQRLIGPPSFLSDNLVANLVATNTTTPATGFRKVPEFPLNPDDDRRPPHSPCQRRPRT